MKLTAQEEYGLRCVLQLAKAPPGETVTINAIATAETLSEAYVAKLMRILRIGGIAASIRGVRGGYRLTVKPEALGLGTVLSSLGEGFYGEDFCQRHTGLSDECVHLGDCSKRAVLQGLDQLVKDYLSRFTIADLLSDETCVANRVDGVIALTMADSTAPR